MNDQVLQQLKKYKSEIIAFLGKKDLPEKKRIIEPISREENIPLSFAQQRLWFIDQLEGSKSNYNIFQSLHLQGNLNLSALQKTISTIVKRHEILRTNFEIKDNNPVQIIHPADNVDVQLCLINIENLPSAEKQSVRVEEILSEEAQKPFDLKNDHLCRFSLLRLEKTSHILAITIHHTCFDGWSMGILLQELFTLYQAFSQQKSFSLEPLTIQYADFAFWQRQWLSGVRLEQQLRYWRSHLENAPALLDLPRDNPRPTKQSYRGDSHFFHLNSSLTGALQNLSQKSGVSLFMTLLTAFAILLFRYTSSEDMVIGTAIANRNRPELEPLIGFFANTLALRMDLKGQPSFLELLSRVRQITLNAYRNQDLPFEKLVEEIQPQRTLNYHPLFQVMFVLQNQKMDNWDSSDLKVSSIQVASKISNFDLAVSITEKKGQLEGRVNYKTDLFNRDRIERMVEHFQTLLEGIVNNPQEKITHLPLLTEAKKQQILIDWNKTEAEYPKDKCLHQLFEEQVIKTPDNIALVFEEQRLTYQELNEKANQLAHYLRKLGVKAETLVGICIERSLEMIIGILGILKAGGAYVPLDPTYPKERLQFMLEDSQISILLTQEKLVNLFKIEEQRIIQLDKDWKLIEKENSDNLLDIVHSHNLAYVIYTSGSTGKPKGVAVEHFSVVNIICYRTYQQLKPQDLQVFAFISSLSFDVSVIQIFPPLMVGGKMIIVKDLSHFETLSHEEKISFFSTLPSIIERYISDYKLSENIEAIGLGGEAVSHKLVEKLASFRHIKRILNSYGPTETTVASCFNLLFERR
jgi:non-ribosomal peptide synthetase component F